MPQRPRTIKVGPDRRRLAQPRPATEPEIVQPIPSPDALTKAASLIREMRRPTRKGKKP